MSHRGQFRLDAHSASAEQVLFVASHWGRSGTPAERDLVLAQVTIENDGPATIRVSWDAPPPYFDIPVDQRGFYQVGSDEQSMLLPARGRVTLVVAKGLKVRLESPAVDPVACGHFSVAPCCPPRVWTGSTDDARYLPVSPWGTSPSPAPAPLIHSAAVFAPADNVGPVVPVRFVLFDPGNELLDIQCEYSINGGAWSSATPANDGDATTSLPSPYVGADYRFMWNAAQDVGATPPGGVEAAFRITPMKRGVPGQPGDTSSTQPVGAPKSTFTVSTDLYTPSPIRSAAPSPSVVAHMNTVDSSGTTVSGQQTGLAGLLLPEPLLVKVLDQNGQPLVGVRVTFFVVPPSSGGPLPLAIEPLAGFRTTTNASGMAGVRGRISAGIAATTSPISVEARVVGADPTMVGRFTVSVDQPTIVTDLSPGTNPTVTYGDTLSFRIRVSKPGGALNDPLLYTPDPARPLKLSITGVGIQVSHGEARLPDAVGNDPVLVSAALVAPAPMAQQTIHCTGPITVTVATGATPTPPTVAAPKIVIACPDDPTIPALTIDVRPRSLPIAKRNAAVHSEFDVCRQDLQTYLRPDPSTWPSWPTSLVAYPGLPLSQAFRVQLTDGIQAYDQEVVGNTNGCGGSGPPQTQSLRVEWSSPNGLLSRIRGSVQGQATLSADIGEEVFFLPQGAGPYVITVRGNANGNPTYDPNHNHVEWSDTQQPPGHHCFDDYTLPGATGLSFVFVIQEAFNARFELSPLPHPVSPYDTIRPGDVVQLKIRGLSPAAASAPLAPIVVAALDGALAAPQGPSGPYVGYGYEFTRQISLTYDAATNTLSSGDILLTQGDPMPAPTGTVIACIPNGWVRAGGRAAPSAGGAILEGPVWYLPYAGRRIERVLIDGVESMQSSPVGTSPVGGAEASVLLHNGEFVHAASDLAIPTRIGPLSFNRVHRGHVLSSGPLGPGWFHEHDVLLDVSNPACAIGLLNCGRSDELLRDAGQNTFLAPKGFFFDVARHDVEADHSPYELRDPHGTVTHFHVDGSLRFVRDRGGNLIRYVFDVHARLRKIIDPHGREIALDYRTDGKLATVTWKGRTVQYGYFDVAAPEKGRLQVVTPPPVPTVLSGKPPGTPAVSHERKEWYAYDNLRLASIVDSEGRQRLKNDLYDATGRVKRQLVGQSTIPVLIEYLPASTPPSWVVPPSVPVAHYAMVTDRRGKQTVLAISQSPFPDGAAAAVFVDEKQATFAFAYNRDGNLVLSRSPVGDQTQYLYDDADPDVRRRGNLRQTTRVGASAGQQVWTFEYDFRFNLVSRWVGPLGNASSNPEVYATRYLYDYRVTADDVRYDPDLSLALGKQAGNLVRVLSPRSLHHVVTPEANGRIRARWIDSHQSAVFRYNGFGLCEWERDAHGVVTTYEYYSDANPTGGASSSGGGGFLAKASRDDATSARREVFLGATPREPRSSQWRYDDLGHPSGTTDHAGTNIIVETNDLNEVTRVVQPSAATSSPAQPSVIERQFAYNTHGKLVQTRLKQANASADAGGAELVSDSSVDANGNLLSRFLTKKGGGFAETKLGRDENDMVTTFFPFDVQAGVAASSGFGVIPDARGLPGALLEGTAPPSTGGTTSSLLRSPDCKWTDDHRLERLQEPGAAAGFTMPRDGLGFISQLADPVGHTITPMRDQASRANRGALEWNGVPLDFAETRISETGREGREHVASHVAGPGSTLGPPPEHFGSQPWQAGVGAPYSRGRWGTGAGRRTTDPMLDADGLLTRFVGDDLGHLLVQRDAHGRPVRATLHCGDDASQTEVVRAVRYEYDNGGSLKALTVTDAASNSGGVCVQSWTFEHDQAGRRVRTVDGEGNVTRVELDETGHAYANYDGAAAAPGLDGNLTTRGRDALGHPTGWQIVLTSDGKGGSPRDTANPVYNPTAVVGESLSHSADGRLVSHTDQRNETTAWSYDAFGRLATIGSGGRTYLTVDYDPTTGRPNKLTDGNNTSVDLVLDDLERVVLLGLPGGGGHSFKYEGNVVTATDRATGRVLELVFDSHERLVRERQGADTVEMRFTDPGRRVLVYPSGHGDVEYRHDAIGRLRAVIDRGVEVARYEYIGPRRLLQRTVGSVVTNYRYDMFGAGRLRGSAIRGIATGDVDFEVVPDAMGRLATVSRTALGHTELRELSYDSAGRIVGDKLTPSPQRAPTTLVTERLFDGDSVLREERRDEMSGGTVLPRTVVQERAWRGRITVRDGVTLGYDDQGDLQDDGAQAYSYDALHRLIEVRRGGQSVARFDYDSLDRCIRRTSPLGVEEYRYHQNHLIEVLDPGGGVKERYVYGEQLDDLISVEMDGRRFRYLYAPNGYIDALLDDQDQIVERYDYSLDGVVTVLDVAGAPVFDAALRPAAPRSRFVFQRRPFDPETGLYDYRKRWYHPGLGLFLTPDPAGFAEGTNHYALDHGDPVNYSDPHGTDDQPGATRPVQQLNKTTAELLQAEIAYLDQRVKEHNGSFWRSGGGLWGWDELVDIAKRKAWLQGRLGELSRATNAVVGSWQGKVAAFVTEAHPIGTASRIVVGESIVTGEKIPPGQRAAEVFLLAGGTWVSQMSRAARAEQAFARSIPRSSPRILRVSPSMRTVVNPTAQGGVARAASRLRGLTTIEESGTWGASLGRAGRGSGQNRVMGNFLVGEGESLSAVQHSGRPGDVWFHLLPNQGGFPNAPGNLVAANGGLNIVHLRIVEDAMKGFQSRGLTVFTRATAIVRPGTHIGQELRYSVYLNGSKRAEFIYDLGEEMHVLGKRATEGSGTLSDLRVIFSTPTGK